MFFPKSHRWSEISSPSKMILVLGKARSLRAPNLGFRGTESPGWFEVSPKNSAWDVMHERACCGDEAASHQLPIDAAYWTTWIVSTEECSSSSKIWSRFVALLAQSFWMWQSHRTHAHSTVSTAPLTSTVKSALFTHVHSSPLSLAARLHRCRANRSHYTDNVLTFSRLESQKHHHLHDTISSPAGPSHLQDRNFKDNFLFYFFSCHPLSSIHMLGTTAPGTKPRD